MSNVEEYQNVTRNTVQDKTVGLTMPDFDLARYRSEVDQFDISEQQKQELLTTLWSIMRSFVELGFQGDVCAMVFPDIATIPDDDEVG